MIKDNNILYDNLFTLLVAREYIDVPEKFTNTSEFQETANFFRKHNCYTIYPKGTYQYIEFWKEERRKCIEGMTNSSGIYIPGVYYYYLNYVQIQMQNKDKRKSKDFPRFVDLDYVYFHLVMYCKNNEKSLVSVKGRRQGWSYKAGALASWEFNFYPNSSSVIGAYLSDYSQNTMNMVRDNCNFLNEHTEFGRQRNPDLTDFIRAAYQVDVGGKKVWKGYMSVVSSITYKDKPSAGVGRSATWLIFDEAGIFPNIIDSYGLSEPLIRDGNIYTGVCLMFGSSDSMEAGSVNFKKIFINPNEYNMLSFKDPKNSERLLGFFSAAYFGRWGKCKNPDSPYFNIPMVDDDGNSNIHAAIDDILHERSKKKKSPDPKVYRDFVTQFPISWEEAFLVSSKSPFPTYLAQERLAVLETDKSIINAHWIGRLDQTDQGIKFNIDVNKEPIRDFPINKIDSNISGCIEIYEQPYVDKPPLGMYIAGIDPYDDDNVAENSESLGSIFIMHSLTGRIVAEYTGRPSTAKEFYETCRKLLLYYNAIANYENNKKGIFGYFEQKNCLHLLCDTPKILKDMQIIKVSYDVGNNSKGTNATLQVNKYARELLKTWMLEQAYNKEDGICNIHTLSSIPALKEIIYWEPEGNYDRVSALGMLMILREDRYKLSISYEEDQIEDNQKFFDDIYSKYNKSYNNPYNIKFDSSEMKYFNSMFDKNK
jgi:hypothetical protein